jgi:hypothetical protein
LALFWSKIRFLFFLTHRLSTFSFY